MTTRRDGFTLLEMLAAMTVVGLIAAVTLLAPRSAPAPDASDAALLADSVRSAVTLPHQTGVRIAIGEDSSFARVEPDGSVIADSAFEVDRLSGASTTPTRHGRP